MTEINNQYQLLVAIVIDNGQVRANLEWFRQVECLPNCQHLECGDNQLTQLPQLPMCQHLECSHNQLTQLPDLSVCQILLCGYNQLTQLPELPMCGQLWCQGNQLTKLPDLPMCNHLWCYDNQLTQLPELSVCLALLCGNNQLIQLPEIPVYLYLECNGNPDLYYTKKIQKRYMVPESPFITNLSQVLSQIPTLMLVQHSRLGNNSPLSLIMDQQYGIFQQFHTFLKELRLDQ